MKVQVERKLSIESAEKLQKFLLAVARFAFSDHRPREHMEGPQINVAVPWRL
jgi:hypothetical protein